MQSHCHARCPANACKFGGHFALPARTQARRSPNLCLRYVLRLCAPTTVIVLPSSAMRRAEMITTKGPRGTKQNLIPCVPTWLCSRKAMGNREPLAQLGQRGQAGTAITSCMPLPHVAPAHNHTGAGGQGRQQSATKARARQWAQRVQRPSRTTAAQCTIRDITMSAGAGLHNALCALVAAIRLCPHLHRPSGISGLWLVRADTTAKRKVAAK